MDSLDQTEWDVTISGTGLPQSLLALALSRSGLRILHLDRNGYYGGNEAALALRDAEEWTQEHGDQAGQERRAFSQAELVNKDGERSQTGLGPSRAYSLALAPQLVYTRSNLLPVLVSSRTHEQMDFQAVGSWFTISAPLSIQQEQSIIPTMMKVPSGREDIFADNTLDLRAKRSLTKFLRFVSAYDTDELQAQWASIRDKPVAQSLREDFGLRTDAAVAPLLGLALVPSSSDTTVMAYLVPRIARHMRSTGLFGPGFSAVLPKWGGLAEVAQVACRACAVGGGVYVLGQDAASASTTEDGRTEVKLSGSEKVTTKWLVGCVDDLPHSFSQQTGKEDGKPWPRSITIVSSPLTSLFPTTSEGGVTPAGAVIAVDSPDSDEPPVHIVAHASDSGECPQGQCVLYASTASENGMEKLDLAVKSLLQSVGEDPKPQVLWSMRFLQRAPRSAVTQTSDSAREGNVIRLQTLSTDVVLEDGMLEDVKKAWHAITGESEEHFMKFEPRNGEAEDDSVL